MIGTFRPIEVRLTLPDHWVEAIDVNARIAGQAGNVLRQPRRERSVLTISSSARASAARL